MSWPVSSRKTRSKGIWPLSGGSNPTFCKAAGIAEAAGPVLLGTAWARSAVPAASKSAAIPTIWRTFFISLFFFLHRRRRDSRQASFGNDLHRIFHGNLRDVAGSINPLQLFIGL